MNTAVQELEARVRQLYYEAEEPSFRQIARALRTVSHTTVHNAVRSPATCLWRTLSGVIVQLGGEPADFIELHRAAKAERKTAVPRQWGVSVELWLLVKPDEDGNPNIWLDSDQLNELMSDPVGTYGVHRFLTWEEVSRIGTDANYWPDGSALLVRATPQEVVSGWRLK